MRRALSRLSPAPTANQTVPTPGPAAELVAGEPVEEDDRRRRGERPGQPDAEQRPQRREEDAVGRQQVSAVPVGVIQGEAMVGEEVDPVDLGGEVRGRGSDREPEAGDRRRQQHAAQGATRCEDVAGHLGHCSRSRSHGHLARIVADGHPGMPARSRGREAAVARLSPVADAEGTQPDQGQGGADGPAGTGGRRRRDALGGRPARLQGDPRAAAPPAGRPRRRHDRLADRPALGDARRGDEGRAGPLDGRVPRPRPRPVRVPPEPPGLAARRRPAGRLEADAGGDRRGLGRGPRAGPRGDRPRAGRGRQHRPGLPRPDRRGATRSRSRSSTRGSPRPSSPTCATCAC